MPRQNDYRAPSSLTLEEMQGIMREYIPLKTTWADVNECHNLSWAGYQKVTRVCLEENPTGTVLRRIIRTPNVEDVERHIKLLDDLTLATAHLVTEHRQQENEWLPPIRGLRRHPKVLALDELHAVKGKVPTESWRHALTNGRNLGMERRTDAVNSIFDHATTVNGTRQSFVREVDGEYRLHVSNMPYEFVLVGFTPSENFHIKKYKILLECDGVTLADNELIVELTLEATASPPIADDRGADADEVPDAPDAPDTDADDEAPDTNADTAENDARHVLRGMADRLQGQLDALESQRDAIQNLLHELDAQYRETEAQLDALRERL